MWADPFETPEEATLARSKLQQEQDDLRGAVRLALGAADHDDPWLSISVADYKFMTAAKAAVAKAEYEKALAYPAIFNSRSARRQLQLFSDLGLKKDRVEQCLGIFPTMSSSSTQKHVVVFNGLRVDDASKPGVSRFPDAMTEPARCRDPSKAGRAQARHRDCRREERGRHPVPSGVPRAAGPVLCPARDPGQLVRE